MVGLVVRCLPLALSSPTTRFHPLVRLEGGRVLVRCAPGRLLQYLRLVPLTYVHPFTRRHVFSLQPWQGETLRVLFPGIGAM